MITVIGKIYSRNLTRKNSFAMFFLFSEVISISFTKRLVSARLRMPHPVHMWRSRRPDLLTVLVWTISLQQSAAKI
jgi:hypothetical protein